MVNRLPDLARYRRSPQAFKCRQSAARNSTKPFVERNRPDLPIGGAPVPRTRQGEDFLVGRQRELISFHVQPNQADDVTSQRGRVEKRPDEVPGRDARRRVIEGFGESGQNE